MAITCTCPKCGRFCGFKEIYAGRSARCLNCSTHFVIPCQNGQKALAVSESPHEPAPGFYRKVLFGTAATLLNKESVLGIALCIVLTVFHFLTGNADYSFTLPGFRLQLFLGWAATFICSGYLLWYFMEIINVTVMENDILPDISIGTGFTFIGESIKSIYQFVSAFAVSAIPGAAATAVLEKMGISNTAVNACIMAISLCTLPMMLGMLGSGVASYKLFRYDMVWRVIIKCIRPYLLTLAVTFIAMSATYATVGFFAGNPDTDFLQDALMLLARLAAVFSMIVAMRTIGLFALHYYPCFPFLKKID